MTKKKWMSVVAGGLMAASVVLAVEETKNADVKRTVLVAAESSNYKKVLGAKACDVIEQKGCQCKSLDLKALGDVALEDCAAVIVMTSFPEWGRSKSVPKLVEKGGDAVKAKLIVVTTARKATWKAPVSGVDAITTASVIDNVDEIVGKIGKGLDTILAK